MGVGVLLLASAVAKLGWIIGLLMLFGFFPLNMYTGILLSRTRQLLPKSVTMGDMAMYTYGKCMCATTHSLARSWFDCSKVLSVLLRAPIVS